MAETWGAALVELARQRARQRLERRLTWGFAVYWWARDTAFLVRRDGTCRGRRRCSVRVHPRRWNRQWCSEPGTRYRCAAHGPSRLRAIHGGKVGLTIRARG